MKTQNTCTTTFVCRDNQGTLIHFNSKKAMSSSPFQAEMLALKEASKFTSRFPNKQFIIKSDCLAAIQLCNSAAKERPWEADVIWEEIQRITSNTGNVRFRHVYSSANMVTDWLAKHQLAALLCNYGFNVILFSLTLFLRSR